MTQPYDTGQPGVFTFQTPLTVNPSGDQSGVIDTQRINAAISGGGTVNLAPGQWYIQCGQIVYAQSLLNASLYLRGSGNWTTFVNAIGSGDLIRMFGTSANRNLGGVSGMTIDGTSTTGASSGIHIGDGIQAQLDCVIQNFAQPGSIGLHLDNTQSWSEQFRGTVRLSNCATHVVFDVNANGFNSFARTNIDFTINAAVGQDGVVVQNGAFLYDGALSIRGNFASSPSVPMTNAVLRVTGQAPGGDPNATGFTVVRSCRLDIGAETTVNANTPQTINFGTPGSNAITGCYGVMDFSVGGASFTKSNYVSTNANTFIYLGPIMGDTNLSGNPNGSYSPMSTGALLYNRSNFNTSNGNFFVASGDFFSNTLSANITVTFQGPFLTGPQRKTIVITQAAAGGFTVTWPHNAAPTTSNPKIVWAAGTAPVMTATANAVDVYKLETVDGATWYGQAIQNVS